MAGPDRSRSARPTATDARAVSGAPIPTPASEEHLMNVHSLSVGRWARRLVLSLALCSGLAAAELPADVTALQDDWAVAYFNTTGDAQETAMAELVTRSEAVCAVDHLC